MVKKIKELIPCAYCKGKGVDPYRIMSELSTCCACLGKKTIEVITPFKECLFCRGSGEDLGGRYSCGVCGGAGVVHVPRPSQPCPECEGVGITGGASLYCTNCKGTGGISLLTT